MEQNNFQRSLDIVIYVLKTKDIGTLIAIKDFLYALPSFKDIEQVLASAVLHYAQHDRDVFDWLISNRTVLAPELDLFIYTRTLVRSRLREKGWSENKDFWFDLDSILWISSSIQCEWDSYFSFGELLVIKTIVKVRS